MIRLHRARRADHGQKPKRSSRDTWLRLTLALFTWAALCLILLGYNLFPGRVALRVGEISPRLIRAPRMARYVDLEETERLRRQAEQRVAPQYKPLPYALADAEKRVDRAFAALRAARHDRASLTEAGPALSGVSADSLDWALAAPASRLEELRREARSILREVMSEEIREATADQQRALSRVDEMAGEQEQHDLARALLVALVTQEVSANRRLDPEGTAAERAAARQRVQPVERTIEADHTIIFAGERVTDEHLAMLEAVGLSGRQGDYRRAAAIALLVALIVVLIGAQTRHWSPSVYAQPKLLLLLCLLVVVSLFLVSLLSLSLQNVWMLIVPSAALIAAVLMGDRVGIALAVGLSLLVGLSENGGLSATLLALGSSAAAVSLVSHIWPVSRLRWIVGGVAATNLVLVVAVALLQQQRLETLAREAVLAAALYAPGTAALSLGGIFLLQRPFGITTHLELLELSNPQHPLLRRLQAEAPGTYFASITVANLADAAAEVTGADPLLARVGALYHDVGKLHRPAFFVENQALLGQENVHDHLSSSLSGLVIVSHVKDGVVLAREYRLPQPVLDIIEQHHGMTLVSFFYHQALSGDRPESVSEEQFRYPGPRPRSKEAALVMLADSVQAAVQSLSGPTPQRVQQMVSEVIRDRAVGGQLEECDLTFRDVTTVTATMTRILTALLCHARIEYPESVAAKPGA